MTPTAAGWLEHASQRERAVFFDRRFEKIAFAVGVFVELPGVGGRKQPVVQAACPVVDLQALDKNQQILSELQDLDDDSSNDNSQVPVSE